MKLLLEKKANIEAKDRDKQTTLYIAAWKGHEAIVKLLLEKRANIKAEDRYKQTALYIAALKGHPAIVKLLLDKGLALTLKINISKQCYI